MIKSEVKAPEGANNQELVTKAKSVLMGNKDTYCCNCVDGIKEGKGKCGSYERFMSDRTINMEISFDSPICEFFKDSDQLKAINFNNIIGQNEAKDKILTALSAGLKPNEIRDAYLKSIGMKAIRGIMLYGVPGVGKTETLRALELSLKDNPLIECEYVPCSAFQGGVGTNAEKIAAVFDRARSTKKNMFVMLLDEIDSIFMKKRGMLNVAERTNALQSEMDGMKDSSNIIIIATTNRIANIEDAMLSRFRDIVELYPPNDDERLQFIEKYIKPIPFTLPFDSSIMARDTKGFTGRNFRDIGLKMIDKYSQTNKPVDSHDLIKEVNKYAQRAGHLKNLMMKEQLDD